MANYLDAVYHALSDPTRRAVLAQLASGEAAVSVLARPHSLALPTFLKHLGVLEQSGLVRTRKVGRTRLVTAERTQLAAAEGWIRDLHTAWSGRLDRLEAWLEQHDEGVDDAP